ncbi:MAG: PspC domain-containing protein [Actinomycetaceae bacterium]|nr:PspC domain-containing protein [Actinomycetaceae bacterium]
MSTNNYQFSPNVLWRSSSNKVLGGVLGGICEKIGWDPTILRILYVLLTLSPFPGIIIYLLAWLLIPER